MLNKKSQAFCICLRSVFARRVVFVCYDAPHSRRAGKRTASAWWCHSGMMRSDGEVSARTPQESNTINGWEDETAAALDPSLQSATAFYDTDPVSGKFMFYEATVPHLRIIDQVFKKTTLYKLHQMRPYRDYFWSQWRCNKEFSLVYMFYLFMIL